MKIGRKGFMLAEVVVVSTVIAVVLVTLYIGLNNVTLAYEVRNRYYDVDSLYVAMEINDILIDDNKELANTISGASDIYTYSSSLSFNKRNSVNSFIEFYSSSDKVGDSLYIYVSPYNKDIMLELKGINNNVYFDDYLDYLSTNLNFNDNFDYMIIVERRENKDVNDSYWYSLKLKY